MPPKLSFRIVELLFSLAKPSKRHISIIDFNDFMPKYTHLLCNCDNSFEHEIQSFSFLTIA